MTTILLTGKNGQLGWELHRTLVPIGEVEVLNRDEMDLANPDSIRNGIRRVQPDLIVNAAAFTAVDQAESEPQLAMAINGLAPGILAEEAKRLNAGIIHFSTDYVFDGTANRPYREDDTPNPLNVYGKTKLAGERAILAMGVPHIILRTSWLYSARGRNFLLTILRLAGEKRELKIVDDQIGAPTWSRLLAEITSHIVMRSISSRSRPVVQMTETSGIYHAVSAGSTSWYGFAKKILEIARDHALLEMPKLIPITSSDYPLPAARPRNSCLSNEKITRSFGLVIPSWEESLTLCLQEMYGKQVA